MWWMWNNVSCVECPGYMKGEYPFRKGAENEKRLKREVYKEKEAELVAESNRLVKTTVCGVDYE